MNTINKTMSETCDHENCCGDCDLYGPAPFYDEPSEGGFDDESAFTLPVYYDGVKKG